MDELVMYIVVNIDLKMGKGKIAAQVAHSAVKVAHDLFLNNKESWTKWYGGSYTKIVLKASGNDLQSLVRRYGAFMCRWTFDEGRTQIGRGSLTTVAFFPVPKALCPEELKKMKLL